MRALGAVPLAGWSTHIGAGLAGMRMAQRGNGQVAQLGQGRARWVNTTRSNGTARRPARGQPAKMAVTTRAASLGWLSGDGWAHLALSTRGSITVRRMAAGRARSTVTTRGNGTAWRRVPGRAAMAIRTRGQASTRTPLRGLARPLLWAIQAKARGLIAVRGQGQAAHTLGGQGRARVRRAAAGRASWSCRTRAAGRLAAVQAGEGRAVMRLRLRPAQALVWHSVNGAGRAAWRLRAFHRLGLPPIPHHFIPAPLPRRLRLLPTRRSMAAQGTRRTF